MSLGERRRLFDRPACTWADYDPALISPGGGVWPRSAKSIPISAEARAVLGIENRSLLPSHLIRALLKAPVDLLWNGGSSPRSPPTAWSTGWGAPSVCACVS